MPTREQLFIRFSIKVPVLAILLAPKTACGEEEDPEELLPDEPPELPLFAEPPLVPPQSVVQPLGVGVGVATGAVVGAAHPDVFCPPVVFTPLQLVAVLCELPVATVLLPPVVVVVLLPVSEVADVLLVIDPLLITVVF